MPKNKQAFCFKFRNANGIRYEVRFRKPNTAHFGKADGYCDDPEEESPRIYINPHLTQKSELNTIIHELCHAFFWDKSEREVYKFANTVTAFLYRQGWRKNKELTNNEPPPPRKRRNNKSAKNKSKKAPRKK
tara:strand:- start:237 stop:632 length:396 start_codon:yes stop_codon:yes gene_type:complete